MRKYHPLFWTWIDMRRRCYDEKFSGYKYYGARGIKVCERWQGPGGFQNFVADMGEKSNPRFTLDRADNDGDYEPGNCRWLSPHRQMMNRQKSKTTIYLAHERATLNETKGGSDGP